jgi:uncharacterized protein
MKNAKIIAEKVYKIDPGRWSMRRLISDKLVEWKNRRDRKPLILKGVRQCGKTYILTKFGEENYDDIAYINFEETPSAADLFTQDLNPHRIIVELGVVLGKKINPESTLIFFDEIQFSPHALTSLKYFCEQTPEYHIACAGSLLGVALSKPKSFPVGKIDSQTSERSGTNKLVPFPSESQRTQESIPRPLGRNGATCVAPCPGLALGYDTFHFLTLYPLNFHEFILVNGESDLLSYLEPFSAADPISTIIADKLTSYLKTYYITGGMPAVVAAWLEHKDINEIDRVQDAILDAYQLDFAKHAPSADFPKLSLLWNSIPNQLAKENRKFMYSMVKQGARAKEFESALQWLLESGVVYKIKKIGKPAIPLSAYANTAYFKLYLSDVGLLRRMARLPAAVLWGDSPLYSEFKGALAENFVLTELVTLHEETPYYWKSENIAELDFIVQYGDKIIPIEVKASQNVKSRSLGVYREKYDPEISIRISLRNLRKDGKLLNIPLYMLWNIDMLIRES